MNQATLIGLSRLRLGTDGHGITTLVAFHGCPLRCKYCLNPQCLSTDAKVVKKSPEELMKILMKDELYYVASKGGVTFGGGEPFLNAEFIKDVLELGAKKWHTTIETSLNVPLENIQLLLPYIDEYVIDIKDMKSSIYQAYTGIDNKRVKENLRWLVNQGKASNIICRIPLIENYNKDSDRENSLQELEELGINRFDKFTYKTNTQKL